MQQNTDKIEVEFPDSIKDKLKKIFSYKGKTKKPPEVILESGTYLGQGTTKEIAEILVSLKKNISFYTLEPKDWIYEQAKKNLEQYRFIQPLFGMSLNLDECLEFISNDEVIKNHQDFPDLLIDCTKDPVYMYRTEIWSCFSGKTHQPTQGLFYEMIPQFKESNPLIVLDSAGGIGWLEFQTVVKLMEENPYYLLCDDKKHLKHFRTYEWVSNRPNWKILAEDDRTFLAEYTGE